MPELHLTDRTRKVFHLAKQEAERLGDRVVGTEHVLIGLIKEGSGVASHILREADVKLSDVRDLISKTTASEAVAIDLVKSQASTKGEPVAVNLMSSRSRQHQQLKRILCDFAGVEFSGVRKIEVEIDTDSGCIPIFRIEKMAVSETADKALLKQVQSPPSLETGTEIR